MNINVYETKTMRDVLCGNPYVGRGIVIGRSRDGKKAAAAYFIMGRSANSRNRVFTKEGEVLYTRPYDESLVEDPSLIIYAASRQYENKLIVTNGDQTDTVYAGLQAGKTFAQSLESREFEPDRPNFTPRISGMLTFAQKDFTYEMSILKSADAAGTACVRECFSYPALPGIGHFIHTYITDGNPLPTFCGEPERVEIPNSIEEMTAGIWENLNCDNRISLYVRYVDLATGEVEEKILNRNA